MRRLVLGELIRVHRKRREFSLRSLGEYVQLSAGFLCDVEAGNRSISAHNLQKVLTALDLTWAELDGLSWRKP